jgi:hypothetical protein
MQEATIPATVSRLSLSEDGTRWLLAAVRRELHFVRSALPDPNCDDGRAFGLVQIAAVLQDDLDEYVAREERGS